MSLEQSVNEYSTSKYHVAYIDPNYRFTQDGTDCHSAAPNYNLFKTKIDFSERNEIMINNSNKNKFVSATIRVVNHKDFFCDNQSLYSFFGLFS